MTFAGPFIRSIVVGPWLVAWLLLAGAAYGQVLINPVVVELGARQRAASVTVTLGSKAQSSVRLQSQILQWDQALDGTPRYEPSNDLVVAPPIAELKPGQSQLFRVALRGPRRQAGELAYRLVLEDTTQPSPDPTRAVSFRLRYDLPVLVAPAEPVREVLVWQSCAAKSGEVCARLLNQGNRRITFQALNIEGSGWSVPINTPGTVLAGAQREWRLPLPAGQAGAAVRISGTTRAGAPVQALLAPP